MKEVTEVFKNEIEALGDDPISASLNKHRTALSDTSEEALAQIKDELPVATFSDKVKAYDITRKHLNVIDGRNDGTQQNIIIIPGESAARYDLSEEINQQICQNQPKKKSLTTLPKPKSQPHDTDSE